MNDERLAARLRAALPPTRDVAARRDLLESLVARLEQKSRWSLLDFGLAAAAAVALSFFPRWLWPLLHYL